MNTVEININYEDKTSVSSLIFGNFIEHIESCIEGGIFDKGNELSNEDGIRLDVLEKCKQLAPTIVRFPGGTVMGIYHWEDHIGPVEQRKKMRNVVWGGMLTHEFGTAEFVQYCRTLGAEPMLCINMPTGTPEEAANWVEYCNSTADSYYANLRRSHGYEEPFNVKYWCIGNECYAKADLGIQHDVDVYIKESWEFIKYMKLTDDSIKTVLVGYDDKWNKAVLDDMSDVCDYLSVHFYASTTKDENVPFVMLKDFAKQMDKLAITLDEYNKKDITLERWYRFSPRQNDIKISLDEWNIWNADDIGISKYGLIQNYTWKDALWVGCFLNMMINRSKFIGIANLAQMVNVIAPIMADKSGSFLQTTFYPLMKYREMVGDDALSFSASSNELDISVTQSENDTKVFAVNASKKDVKLVLNGKVVSNTVLYCDDVYAKNSMDNDFVQIKEEVYTNEQSIPIKAGSINIIKLL